MDDCFVGHSILLAQFRLKVYHRDCVEIPGLDHPVHQFPLSGEGVELQDVIRVRTESTALTFFSK